MTEIAGIYTDIWRTKTDLEAGGTIAPIASWRYAGPGGSDDGDGSIAKPWATLNHAFAQMAPLAQAAPMALFLTGNIVLPVDEANQPELPPNIFLVGVSPEVTTLQTYPIKLSAAWADNTQLWSGGIVNLTTYYGLWVDLREINAARARLFIRNCVMSFLRLTASDAVRGGLELTVTDSFLQGGAELHGVNTYSRGNSYNNNVVVDEGPVNISSGLGFARFSSVCDAFTGKVMFNETAPNSFESPTFSGSHINELDINGNFAVISSLVPVNIVGTSPSTTGATPVGSPERCTTGFTEGGGIFGCRWQSTILGSPEGRIVGQPGDLVSVIADPPLGGLYVKESGAFDNVGWVKK
jgi:hypothetical protein